MACLTAPAYRPLLMSNPLKQAFANHARQWEQFQFVYPVVSRRSRGLSVGINLTPDKVCNFDCIYCFIDRQAPRTRLQRPGVDLEQVRAELDTMLNLIVHGRLWEHPNFAQIPHAYRRLNDIAFSGDAEPTSTPLFPKAVDMAIESKQAHGLEDVRLVVITNATMLDRARVQQALARFDEPAVNGDIWAKLDAGTEDDYTRINRSRVSLQKILNNILTLGQARPITIQTMLLKENGKLPTDAFFNAYLDHLTELVEQGCQIKTIQLYTLARQTAEAGLEPLSEDELETYAANVRERLDNVTVNTFG